MYKSLPLACSAVAALAVTACSGSTTTTTTSPTVNPNDKLAGKSAAQLVKAAQSFLRNDHYHFYENFQQVSSGTNLSGLPAGYAQVANSSITFIAQGDVDGNKHVSAQASVVGIPAPVFLVEVGCSGYSSLNGDSWFQGPDARSLARLVQPNFDDGLTSLAWHDLGATTHGGVDVHHLRGSMTALGWGGAAPSPGATQPPGVTVQPTPVDLWVRSDGGGVEEFDQVVDGVTDLHAAAVSAPVQFRGATGTAKTHLQVAVNFSAQRAPVTAPAPTLKSDPVPGQVYIGFGSIGVERDDCPSGI